jgi:glycosyltransferase involved in cell wall biosynthesis
MSEKVMTDLRQFEKNKPAQEILHPVYDTFGEPIPKEEARKILGINTNDKILLFFGFIRKYKGLDILLEAMNLLKLQTSNNKQEMPSNQGNQAGIKLLVAGEFYEDEKIYREQIKRLGIEDSLILRTDFIPDSEVRNYLCAADVVVQPYRNATQSGVTPLAYYFEKPMIVTNVGSLPKFVPHEEAGLVCAPEPASLAAAIIRYFELGEQHFIPHLRSEKEKYSWHNLVKTILEM